MTNGVAIRRSGDGRRPVEKCTEFFDVGVHQVHAANPGAAPRAPQPEPLAEPRLEPEELTILMSWAEAIAEVLASAPERLHHTLSEAQTGGTWRAELDIPEPSATLSQTIDALPRLLTHPTPPRLEPPLEQALAGVNDPPPGAGEHEILARRALRSALEQRRTPHQKLGLSLARRHPPGER